VSASAIPPSPQPPEGPPKIAAVTLAVLLALALCGVAAIASEDAEHRDRTAKSALCAAHAACEHGDAVYVPPEGACYCPVR